MSGWTAKGGDDGGEDDDARKTTRDDALERVHLDRLIMNR